MRDDIHIRKIGHAGRITLDRPRALNALTYEMCLAIEAALDDWRGDPEVALVLIDAVGERAFCAGGDIQELYDTAKAGDFAYGRRFWADEYRMNDKIAEYPKPVVAPMQGFTMGGGVGVGCHASHRVVCESSQLAMPEVGIGLVPDVGGSLLLGRAPGHVGEYLGTTAARMGPADAIFAGFADHYIAQEHWLDLIAALEETGDAGHVAPLATTPPEGALAGQQPEIDALFCGDRAGIVAALNAGDSEFAHATLKAVRRNSPLSVACAIEIIRSARAAGTIRAALAMEYRFTWRAAEHGDFIEGIRAAIIDKDRNPRWQHAAIEDVSDADVTVMLADLGQNALKLGTQDRGD
jgi:enoyl-CoA hydratase/carnithine racemase